MNFGEFLKQQREDKDWRQPEAAEAIGIEQSYLSKLENNKAVPSADVFEKLMAVYAFSLQQLDGEIKNSELEKLKDSVAVRDYIFGQRKKGQHLRQRWLAVGLLMLMAGSALLAYGLQIRDQFDTVYLYESKGVILDGESRFVFAEIPDSRSFRRHMEHGSDLKNHPLFNRLDYHQVNVDTYRGDFFDEKGDMGDRRYYLFDSRSRATSRPVYLFISLGTMLCVGGLASFFLSRRW